MLIKRIIPVLLHNNRGLVKTMKFRNPTYIGDPINTVRILSEKQVDEIIILDIERTKLGIGPNLKLIQDVTPESFVPLCYGGGIRNLMDAKAVLNLGVEKIVVQNLLFTNIKVVNEIAQNYGSQSVIAAIDVCLDNYGNYSIYDSSRGNKLKLPLETILQQIKNSFVGEIIVTSVDREGTMKGFDLNLISQIKDVLSIPLIFNGGAGTTYDLALSLKAGADAVAAGSMFVFHGSRKSILINYPDYDSKEKILEYAKHD
jgi:cyclase